MSAARQHAERVPPKHHNAERHEQSEGSRHFPSSTPFQCVRDPWENGISIIWRFKGKVREVHSGRSRPNLVGRSRPQIWQELVECRGRPQVWPIPGRIVADLSRMQEATSCGPELAVVGRRRPDFEEIRPAPASSRRFRPRHGHNPENDLRRQRKLRGNPCQTPRPRQVAWAGRAHDSTREDVRAKRGLQRCNRCNKRGAREPGRARSAAQGAEWGGGACASEPMTWVPEPWRGRLWPSAAQQTAPFN